MNKSAVIKLALSVAITGIVAVVVAFAVYNLKHGSQTGRVPQTLFHQNPLIGHEEEVFKLLYKRDTPNPNDDSTWAEAKKYYFTVGGYVSCYVSPQQKIDLRKAPKGFQKEWWKECSHMARIEMAFAKRQGKFTNSTLDDWLDQSLLNTLFHKQQAKLHYENTH